MNAENYGCTEEEKVQSACWNATAITLHTMVVYSQSGTGTKAQSYVAVSDVMSRNATTVYIILHKFIPTLQNENPNLIIQFIIKEILLPVNTETKLFFNLFQITKLNLESQDVEANLESGHGKGPCD